MFPIRPVDCARDPMLWVPRWSPSVMYIDSLLPKDPPEKFDSRGVLSKEPLCSVPVFVRFLTFESSTLFLRDSREALSRMSSRDLSTMKRE